CDHNPIYTDDSDACTVDACDPAHGGVYHTPKPAPPPPDQCHQAGVCSGKNLPAPIWSFPLQPDGTSCTSGSGYLGSCVTGTCVRLSPITMDSSFESRPWTGAAPTSAASAVSIWNSLPAGAPGYGMATLTSLAGWSNHAIFPGAGVTQNIAYHL